MKIHSKTRNGLFLFVSVFCCLNWTVFGLRGRNRHHFLSLSAAPGCPPSHLNQEEDLMLLWTSLCRKPAAELFSCETQTLETILPILPGGHVWKRVSQSHYESFCQRQDPGWFSTDVDSILVLDQWTSSLTLMTVSLSSLNVFSGLGEGVSSPSVLVPNSFGCNSIILKTQKLIKLIWVLMGVSSTLTLYKVWIKPI